MRIIYTLILFSLLSQAGEPNLVFVFGDDIRNSSLGCAGHPVIKTPNIDRLAQKGVRFENAFVNVSTCWASRATVLTGVTEHTHQYQVSQNMLSEKLTQSTYPVLLSAAGYKTGFAGKTHCRPYGRGSHELFDEGVAIQRPFWRKTADGGLEHTTNIITDWGIEFIKRQSAGQPFCLSLSYNAAHAEDHDLAEHFPHAPEENGLYDEIDIPSPTLGQPEYHEALPPFIKDSISRQRYHWRWDTQEKYERNMRHYYRLISGIDRSLGRVLQTLEKQGLLDNTVVIFLADNGYMMGDRGLAGKWIHYEESLRVPFVVADFRRSDELNKVIGADVLNLDLAPTLLDLAGVEIPKHYQGRSLKQIINSGVEPGEWRRDFLCEFGKNGGRHQLGNWQGVRNQQFTYAHYKSATYDQEVLHDRKTDPTQLKNVAGEEQYQTTLQAMRQRLKEYRERYDSKQVESRL